MVRLNVALALAGSLRGTFRPRYRPLLERFGREAEAAPVRESYAEIVAPAEQEAAG